MVRRALVGILAAIVLGVVGVQEVRADGFIVIPNAPRIIPGHFSFAPLEVTYHHVECDIQDQVAVTSVDQEFLNPNNSRLEGDYMFPVPTGAKIDKFSMDIDGKQVEAELLPAEKARAIYEEIVRKTKDPALLEYAGRAIFRVHIFPIEANGTKHIQLKYTEFLKEDNGLIDYHYTLNTEKFSSKPLQNLSIKVTIAGGEPLTTVYSPTHEVEVKRHGETGATVGYEAKEVRPDQDFHLFIGHKTGAVGISLLTYRPDPNKEGYFVLLATPTVKADAKPMPKDVVFVMDTSGSMGGEKIEQARKALKYCVDTLNPGDRFDVVRFSTEAEPLFGGLKDANEEDWKKADDFAAGLRAAGGTAIDDALAKAIAERPADEEGRVFMLVFMTDGQPTVGEQSPDVILDHVKAETKDAPVRVFSFGVGNDVNTKLLDLLADQTRGYSQYVLPSENLELSMSNFWGKVQDPVLAGLKLESGDVALAKMYPKNLPDLFRGDQLVAFGTYSKAGACAITLTGNAGGTEQKFAQDVTFAEKTDNSNDWIAKLWATRRVGYLLDEIRLHGENKELRDEVVELARKWGVVTPYTAMLIIEDEQQRHVPVAERSMREMERDKVAVRAVGGGMDSLRRKDESGAGAVANSVNTADYRAVKSLAAASDAADQVQSRNYFEGQNAPAMAKAEPVAAAPVVYGEQVGGKDAKELNLGIATENGWQTARAGEVMTGYRVVNSYAQQTRVINNRAFFLNGNQWTDSHVQGMEKAERVEIVFNSDGYFSFLKEHPDAAQYLALGSNVTVEVEGKVYDVVEKAEK